MSAIPGITFATTALVSGIATGVTAQKQESGQFAFWTGAVGTVGAYFASDAAYGGNILGAGIAGAGVGALVGAIIGSSLKD